MEREFVHICGVNDEGQVGVFGPIDMTLCGEVGQAANLNFFLNVEESILSSYSVCARCFVAHLVASQAALELAGGR